MRRRRFSIVAIAALLIVALAVGCTRQEGRRPGPTVPETASAPSSLSLPSDADLKRAAEFRPQLPQVRQASDEEVVQSAQAAAGAIPRVRYDLAERARTLGSTVDQIFAFVRDRVRYEAYTGVLRGAEGTYLQRAGNAADRSLLLAQMLATAGVPVRFAVGRLAPDRAAALFERIFEPPVELEPDAAGSSTGSTPEAQALLGRLRARAARDYALIRPALSQVAIRGGPGKDDVLREMSDHVWVQAQVNSQWMDLDSAFKDATVGRSFAAPDRVVEMLPDESYQQVTIRVTAEYLAGGRLDTETVLEESFRVSDLMDRYIALVHVKHGGLPGAIAGGIAGPDSWIPGLWIQGALYLGKAVQFADQAKHAERSGQPSGGLRGLFGPGGALSSGSQIVAEWFELELRYPGDRSETIRRALVNRATAVWRQSAAHDPSGLRPLARNDDGPTDPRTVHNIWFSAGRHNLYALSRDVELLARSIHPAGPGSQNPPADSTLDSQLAPFALQSLPLLILSDHLIVPALNDLPGIRLYADSPRIVIVSYGIDPQYGSEGFFVLHDLRRDHMRGLAKDPGTAVAVVDRKLWFGLLEGALEHEIGAEYAAATGDRLAAVSSTSNLVGDQGVVVFAPNVAPAGVSVGDAETSARIDAATRRGLVLVVPRAVLKAGPPAWWEVNPEEGDLRSVVGDVNPSRYGGSGGSFGGGGRWRTDESGNDLGRDSRRSGGLEYQAVSMFSKALVVVLGLTFVGLVVFLVRQFVREVLSPLLKNGTTADRNPR